MPGDRVDRAGITGLHTNGFSLARRVFQDWDLHAAPPELGRPLGEALLAPHRCYLTEVQRLQQAGVTIKGLAHITGGGLIDNPPRIVPDAVAFHLHRGAWPIPPLFQLIERGRLYRRSRDGPRLQSWPGHAGDRFARRARERVLPVVGEEAWLVGEAVGGERVCGDRFVVRFAVAIGRMACDCNLVERR